MRKIILALFFLSSVGLGVGYYFSFKYDCGYSIFCYDLFSRFGNPLFYGMGALAIVFLVLLAIPQAFPAWKKFAIWFVPLAALLFAFYPDPGSGDFFSPYPETVYRWASELYVVVSIVIIVVVAIRKRT